MKYILAEMVTERLIREIGMSAKPLPEQIRILETELPTGKARFESALYQTEKLKKITIGKRSLGQDGGGTVVMMVADDKYDIPFILADIAFDSIGKGNITTGFQLRPLVKDAESTEKYVEPFLKWYKAIDKLPSEPVHLDIGKFLKANPAPLNYLGRIPYGYLDEVLKFTEQFFDILLDIYWKSAPVTDARRRKKWKLSDRSITRIYSGMTSQVKCLLRPSVEKQRHFSTTISSICESSIYNTTGCNIR